MRLDKFLKVTQLIKRRTVAAETACEGSVKINSRLAKPSADVKRGDTIEIDMWNYYKKIEILGIPEKNSIPKNQLENFIKVTEYRPKNSEEDF